MWDNGFAWLICKILDFIPFHLFFYENIKPNDFCNMEDRKIFVKNESFVDEFLILWKIWELWR